MKKTKKPARERPGGNGGSVGYGSPPEHSKFKPGQSGNPKGRPKDRRSRSELARAALNRKVTVIERGKRKRITIEELGFRNLADKSAGGNIKAFAYLHAASIEIPDDQSAERTSEFDQQIIREALERLSTPKGKRNARYPSAVRPSRK